MGSRSSCNIETRYRSRHLNRAAAAAATVEKSLLCAAAAFEVKPRLPF